MPDAGLDNDLNVCAYARLLTWAVENVVNHVTQRASASHTYGRAKENDDCNDDCDCDCMSLLTKRV